MFPLQTDENRTSELGKGKKIFLETRTNAHMYMSAPPHTQPRGDQKESGVK